MLRIVCNDTGMSARTVVKYKVSLWPVDVWDRRPRNGKISSTRTIKQDGFRLNVVRLKAGRTLEISTLDSVLKTVNDDDELAIITNRLKCAFLDKTPRLGKNEDDTHTKSQTQPDFIFVFVSPLVFPQSRVFVQQC